jgi:hypothetical protein
MVKTASRIIGSGLVTAALTLGLMTATASAAVAAAPGAHSALATKTCWDKGCIGHDPQVYGCSAATTTTVQNAYAILWNRYSGNCDTNWGRAQLKTLALNDHFSMNVAIQTADGKEFMCVPGPSDTGQMNEYCNGSYGGPNISWTDMVDGQQLTTAYVYIYNALGHELTQFQLSVKQ